jgi:hypothetical protein
VSNRQIIGDAHGIDKIRGPERSTEARTDMTALLIAELIAAGEVRKAELIELAGGLNMPSYVAAILKIPEQLVEERRMGGVLIGVDTGD